MRDRMTEPMESSEPKPADPRRIAGPGEPAAQAHAPFGESEFGGPGLLQVIWQRRWIVLGVTILALAGGLVYIATSTPIYESTSKIYVEKEGPVIISREEGMTMAQSRNHVYTQAELFQSRPILEDALELMKAPEGIKLPPMKRSSSPSTPARSTPWRRSGFVTAGS